MIHSTTGWRRLLTWTYWRFRLAAWWSGRLGFEVVEIITITLPQEDIHGQS